MAQEIVRCSRIVGGKFFDSGELVHRLGYLKHFVPAVGQAILRSWYLSSQYDTRIVSFFSRSSVSSIQSISFDRNQQQWWILL